jgi:serine/threonine-protein kinase
LQDPSGWEQIAPYLDKALNLPPDIRESWLSEIAATTPAVAAEVRKLLEERDALDARGFLANLPLVPSEVSSIHAAFMEIALPRPPTLPDQPGEEVGPYRLIREIGHGGTSIVWLAERSDGQIKRQFALKLPHVGMRNLQLAERFTRERDILAALSHANIARLYDAGVAESGQPYLAMEYVTGSALDTHCNTACLPVRERLRVFLQVLDAVQFAHSQLIIHRDLKPSNILVTPQGRVMLLDFGIAKLLGDAKGADRLVESESQPDAHHRAKASFYAVPLTQFAGRMLTPEYASPEQIAGEALGIGSDIYSLGVVLYELLAGERPYRLKRQTAAAIEEAILTQDPARPSQAPISESIARKRATLQDKLRRSLTGDLDTIVLKALKKRANERYLSIDAFKQDILNHLNRVPVSARPDSHWYHFSRFVSRHRVAVGLGSLALLAIVASALVAVWQGHSAARERDRAVALASRNAAVTDFLGTVITEAAGSNKPVTVSDMLTRSEHLALTDKGGNPENRAAVLAMIAEQYHAMGSSPKAAQLIGQALALLGTSKQSDLRSQLLCKHAFLTWSTTGKDVALQTMTGELGKLQSDPRNAAECLLYRAYIEEDSGKEADGLRDARQAIERLGQADQVPATTEALFLAALAQAYEITGQTRLASEYFEKSLRRYADVGRDRTSAALSARNNMGRLAAAAGMPLRAVAIFDEALAVVRELNPTNSPPTSIVSNRARSLEIAGRYQPARAAFQQGLQLALEQGNPRFRGFCLLGLVSVALDVSDAPAATAYLKEFEKLPAVFTDEASVLFPSLMFSHGRLDILEGRLDAALADFERALSHSMGPNVVTARLGKADTELLLGRIDASAADAREALKTAVLLQGGVPYSHRTGLAWLTLGRALQRSGDSVQARAAFESARRHLSNTVAAEHPALLEARHLLADST